MRHLGFKGASLDEESLLASARRLTRMEDFGDEGFREPFRVLLRAYNEEAELTPSGRWMARLSTLALLCNRLRIQDAVTRHPEILDTPIRRPVFVAGLPRTGTTLLYNVLAQDPAARPLLMWESIFPCARAEKDWNNPAPRIRAARWVVKWLVHLAPGLPSVHPLDAEGPEECIRLLMNTFVTSYALMEYHVPSYYRWLQAQPAEVFEWAYRDYYRQLQVLQWQRPVPGHWLLKSPAHLYTLPALMKVFPDAAVIQTHRDPHKVVPSLCSLFAVYRGIGSDAVRNRRLGPELLEICADMLQRGRSACAPGESARILNLHYAQLVADPIAAARSVYEHFGYALPADLDRRVAEWVAKNPKDKHGKHVYDLAQFGLTAEAIDRVLGGYCREYEIAPEKSRMAGAAA